MRHLVLLLRSVVFWGVSSPDVIGGGVSANIWALLRVLQCGYAAVTALSHDADAGLLLAGTCEGTIFLWQAREVDAFRATVAKKNRTSFGNIDPPDVNVLHSDVGDDVFQLLLQLEVDDQVISKCLVVGAASCCIIGCRSGTVFVCDDWKEKQLLPVVALARCEGRGAIVGLGRTNSFYFETMKVFFTLLICRHRTVLDQ